MIGLRLTATQPIAHGEAGAANQGPSNTTLFNRQLKLIHRPGGEVSAEMAANALQAIAGQYAIPAEQRALLGELTGAGLLAVLFTSLFPRMYPGDGVGLFSGMERYEYLKSRLRDGANRSLTLSSLFSYLCRKLGLPMPTNEHQPILMAYFSLPQAVQSQVLTFLLDQPETCVMAARFINEGVKEGKKAAKAGLKAPSLFDDDEPEFTLDVGRFTPTEAQIQTLTHSNTGLLPVRLPTISANAMRHCMLREPGAVRLLQALDLDPENPIPIGMERFLFGGGNTAAGAKAPGNSDVIEATMRQKYPLVDALGGTVDQFLLTRSKVSIAGWIICKENNDATRAFGIESDTSIFDLLDEETRTRMGIGGKDKESGQMIFSYETLSAGLEMLASVLFQPFTSNLTKACVVQALNDWAASGGQLGARSAVGHSTFSMDWLAEPPAPGALYLDYLEANKDELRAGLLDATFGTGKVLCAA